MKASAPKNIAASVRAKLLNLAKQQGIDFNRLLLLYGQERFLYRVSKSKLRDSCILKGGILFYGQHHLSARPTKDIDFLGSGIPHDPVEIEPVIREILAIKVADGLEFLSEPVSIERIVESAEYEGLRIKLRAKLEQAKVSLQVDIGFGDVVIPAPIKIDYPTLLGAKRFKIRAYSWESVVAEKLEALARFGELSSRVKDFYDIDFLLREKKVNKRNLKKAITETFRNRGTGLRAAQEILTGKSLNMAIKERQWQAFLRKNQIESTTSFAEIFKLIRQHLEPLVMN